MLESGGGPVETHLPPPDPRTGAGAGQEIAIGARDRRYAVFMLLVVSTIAFIDRSILNTVGQAIKTDLHLSDTQLGLLGGALIVFAVVVSEWRPRRGKPQ